MLTSVFKSCSHVLKIDYMVECVQHAQINGLVQDCSNSSVLAMELLQSCTKPLKYNYLLWLTLMSYMVFLASITSWLDVWELWCQVNQLMTFNCQKDKCVKIFYVIQSMYEGGLAYIKHNGQLAPPLACQAGVRQGDILSPNLFNIFLNDLPLNLHAEADSPQLDGRPIRCLLYADDLVLFATSNVGLQKQLDRLSDFCKQWELKINTKKTKVMCISKNKHRTSTCDNLHIAGENLERVKVYKYLGLEINDSGNLIKLSENLCSRSWKAIFKMNAALKGSDINTKLHFSLFDKLIKPITCYGSEVWGCGINQITNLETFWKKAETLPAEKLHIKFTKFSLGVHSKASNVAVRGETGRYPFVITIIKSMLRYWVYINNEKNNNPLLQAAVKEDKQNLDLKGSWHGTLQNVLKLFNINDINVQQAPAINAQKIDRFTSKMCENFENYWLSKLHENTSSSGGKLSLYRQLKPNFRMENYLSQIKCRNHCKALTALRTSAHKLEIETGRYARPFIERDKRYCTLCKKTESLRLGDEHHAIMQCPTFHVQRTKLLSKVCEYCPMFQYLSDYEQFIYLLTCEGNSIRYVSSFVHEVLSASRKPPKWLIQI